MKFISKLFSREKPLTSPPSLILKEDEDFEWIVKPLKMAHYKLEEDSLIQCIQDNKSKKLVYYAVLALSKYGTRKSIKLLKQTVNYPMDDVKMCSATVLGAIAGSQETEYYASLLDSPTYRFKTYPMATIWEVGDERALESVIRLAKKVLNRKIKLNNQIEALYIAEYLERFTDNKVAIELAHKLRSLDLPLI